LRWVQRLIANERRQRSEARFHDHGMKILLTARLFPPLRTGVFLLAGAIRFPFAGFLIADAVYGLIGVGLFFFGSRWLIGLVLRAGHGAVPLGAALGAFLLYYYYAHLRKRELRGGPQPPVSVLEVPPPPVPAAAGAPQSSPEPTARGR
jgi:membrane protein DedA with SNARE-associated domain